MTNLEYWEKRSLERQKKNDADALKVLKKMDAAYRDARSYIESDIFSIFGRFMSDNGLSVTDAQEMLSGQEFKRWRKSLKEYMQEIEAVGVDSLKGQALWLEVEVLSARSRISRLDALHALIGANMAQVAAIQEKAVSEHLEKVFFNDFCESSYDFYTMGLGTVSEAVEKGTLSLTNAFVHEVVTEPWSGSMFSSRIWKNEWNMAQRVSEMVGRSLIAGHSTKRIARDIEEALGVDRRNAERLILTESAHVKTEADLQVFSRLDIDKVEFNVTLDSRTCTTECAQHDGEVIAIKDLKDGVNKPPLHPRCRCRLLPYDEDVAFFEKKYGTRIARDEEGKNISVKGDVTYKEWKEKLVKKSEHQGKNVEVKKEDKSKFAQAEEEKNTVKDESSRKYMNLNIDDLKKMKGKIAKDERSIVYGKGFNSGYIKSGNSSGINAALRNGTPLNEEYALITNTLQSVIDKNVIDRDIMVYRYIDDIVLENMVGIKIPQPTAKKTSEEFFKELDDAVSTFKPNTIYTEKGFMSVSGVITENAFDNRPVLLKIGVPSGSHCYVTTNYKESEIIFGQGTTLVINGAHIDRDVKGRWKIIVDCEVKNGD